MKFIILFLISFLFSSQSYGKIPNEIKNLIRSDFKHYRIARRTDFHSEFDTLIKRWEKAKSRLNTIVEADFNNDGKTDFIIILISKELNKFAFVAFLSKQESYKTYNLKTIEFPKNDDGTIWETMWLKPKGKVGFSGEKYFNAPDGLSYPFLSDYTEEDVQKYDKSVKKYVNMNVLEKTNLPFTDHFVWGDLFYCVEAYYFESGKFKRLEKCD